MKNIEIEYIESGTFIAGEEDCSGIKAGQTFLINREPMNDVRAKKLLHEPGFTGEFTIEGRRVIMGGSFTREHLQAIEFWMEQINKA